MNRPALPLVRLALLALLAAPLSAQIAEGAQTRLVALSLDNAGGPAGADDTTGHMALGDVAGGHMTSPGYRASVGFLAAGEPHDHTAPAVYGVHPPFARYEGGASVAIVGRNFDTWQDGSSLTIRIAGKVCSDVRVVTPSLITFVVPAGDPGPADLVVSTSLGSDVRVDGFVYTPALSAPQQVAPGDVIDLRNVGARGDRFVTFVSCTQQQAHTRYGTLLVGPSYMQLFPPRRYPKPAGISHIPLRVPDDASLVGLSFHFQSLSIAQQAPHKGVLTNATTVSIP